MIGEYVSVRAAKAALLMPVIIVSSHLRSELARYVLCMAAFFLAAKVLEFYDVEVYSAGQVVSGHTFEHLFASLAAGSLLYGLVRQRYHAPRLRDSMG